MLKDDISNVFNFQQCLLFAYSSNHKSNSGTVISAVTSWTAYGHIVDLVTARCFAHTACGLIYLSLAVTTSRWFLWLANKFNEKTIKMGLLS